MITVIIDAGHGGKDPGAVHGDYREKDQTLGIAKRLQVKLAEKNINSILTRDKDEYIPLLHRAEIAKKIYIPLLHRAEIAKKITDNAVFISIHLNASKNHAGTGFESFVLSRSSGDNKELQDMLHEAIAKINTKYRIKDRGKKEASFLVLKHVKHIPAILLELFFIDAAIEKIVGSNYYTEVATAMATAIADNYK